MGEMSKANQIQIGMLGVIIVLLLLQLSGIFDSSSANLRQAAANDLNGVNTTVPTNMNAVGNNVPANNATPTPQPVQPQTPPPPSGPKTNMTFDSPSFDFGTVKEGEKVEHTFKFKNTGKEPLVISNAKGGCGCTVPQWPREPIAPGAASEIKVVFNSQGKAGKRNQAVTITANTEPATTTIRLVGEVEGKGGATATNNNAPTPSIQVPTNK